LLLERYIFFFKIKGRETLSRYHNLNTTDNKHGFTEWFSTTTEKNSMCTGIKRIVFEISIYLFIDHAWSKAACNKSVSKVGLLYREEVFQ
jgi:hypothetical protein